MSMELPMYKDWAPSAHDTKGLGCEGMGHWRVLTSVFLTRDSDILGRSNRAVAEEIFEACNPDGDGYDVLSFSHWACGWFEIILLNPEHPDVMRTAGEIHCALSEHPILDEDAYSELEAEMHDENRCDEHCSMCESELDEIGGEL